MNVLFGILGIVAMLLVAFLMSNNKKAINYKTVFVGLGLISVEQLEECSVHPISSRDENDSLSSTEEVSQLFTSTSRGAFPQK